MRCALQKQAEIQIFRTTSGTRLLMQEMRHILKANKEEDFKATSEHYYSNKQGETFQKRAVSQISKASVQRDSYQTKQLAKQVARNTHIDFPLTKDGSRIRTSRQSKYSNVNPSKQPLIIRRQNIRTLFHSKEPHVIPTAKLTTHICKANTLKHPQRNSYYNL